MAVRFEIPGPFQPNSFELRSIRASGSFFAAGSFSSIFAIRPRSAAFKDVIPSKPIALLMMLTIRLDVPNRARKAFAIWPNDSGSSYFLRMREISLGREPQRS